MTPEELGKFQRCGAALEQGTEELRVFMAQFATRLAEFETDDEGKAVLVSQFVKQFVGPLYHLFPGSVPRQALLDTLEQLASALRSAPTARLQ